MSCVVLGPIAGSAVISSSRLQGSRVKKRRLLPLIPLRKRDEPCADAAHTDCRALQARKRDARSRSRKTRSSLPIALCPAGQTTIIKCQGSIMIDWRNIQVIKRAEYPHHPLSGSVESTAAVDRQRRTGN